LTRAEWARTLRDLFAAPAAPARSCTTLGDCALDRESCESRTCTADPCSRRTFLLDARSVAAQSVALAGSFNGWTPAPMQRIADRWVVKVDLPNGRHEYKFVLDGARWVPDPGNSSRAPDGFGGENSLLEVSCSQGSSSLPDFELLASALPPDGFVTPAYITELARAGEVIGRWAAQDAALIGGCDPAADGCLDAFIGRFGRRAFRRPLDGAEIARLHAAVRSQPDIRAGLELFFRSLIGSPHFLYRSELGAPGSDGNYDLRPHEVASALSYAFWGTSPDEALSAAAERGELSSRDQIEAQARRLLADPRSRPIVGRLGIEWLGVEKVLTVDKHPSFAPGFDRDLRRALLDETEKFFTHVFFDGTHDVRELLLARHTFANERTAALYGLSGARGTALGRVDLPPNGSRLGVLGQGSVLSVYAYSDQTSPVRRGVFVRKRLLCQELGVPPPNAGGIPEVDPNASTRERFAQHSSDPFCASCHRYIDEVGFGFERFDLMGRERATDNGRPIDDRGNLRDVAELGGGVEAPFVGLAELAQALADSGRVEPCLARQIHDFIRGEPDECAIERVSARLAATHDLREAWIAVVTDPTFVRRAAP
jgi:hypothetical protein